nr:class E sortase [Pseudoclavibacter sp. 13-3]
MSRRQRRRSEQSRRARRSVGSVIVTVIGELMLTAGVLVLLFIGWKMWVNDSSVDRSQEAAAAEISQGWQQEATPAAGGQATATPGDPDIHPQGNDVFGVVYIQRLGDTWQRPLARGVEKKPVLDSIGFGWYPDTSLPGQVGNFAIAAHRGGQGSSLRYVDSLTVGDKIVIETRDGWYTYTYRNTEYVMDVDVNVLNPVPQSTAQASDRVLTLTSCNPYPFTNGERIISYSVLDSFQPRSAGAPASLDYLQKG